MSSIPENMRNLYLFLFILIASLPAQGQSTRDEWLRPRWVTEEQVKQHHIRSLTVVAKDVEAGMSEYVDIVSYLDFDAQGRLIRERNYDVYEGDTGYSSLRTWNWNATGRPESAEFNVTSSFENSEWVKYEFLYDAQGNLSRRFKWEKTSDSFELRDSAVFEFDDRGRLQLVRTTLIARSQNSSTECIFYIRDSRGRILQRIDSTIYAGLDTTWFSYGRGNRLAEEWNLSAVDPLEGYYPPIEEEAATDTLPDPTPVKYQKSYGYAPGKITATLRTIGLSPTDVRYSFSLTETWLDDKGLPARISSKYKDNPRQWTCFYYEFY